MIRNWVNKNLTGHEYWGICGSLSLHVGLIILLALSIGVVQSKKIMNPVAPSLSAPVIQAVTIDRQLVTQEIQRIEQTNQKARQQKKQFAASQVQLRREQKKLIQEKAQLTQLKSQLNQLKQQTRQKSELLTAEQKKLQDALVAQQQKSEQLTAKINQQVATQKALELERQKLEQLEFQATQNRIAQISQEYIWKIQNKIKNNHQYLLHLPNDLKTEMTFFLTPTGYIKNFRITASSGSDAYDQSTITALQKSLPFEMPEDALVLETLSREITLGFINEHAG